MYPLDELTQSATDVLSSYFTFSTRLDDSMETCDIESDGAIVGAESSFLDLTLMTESALDGMGESTDDGYISPPFLSLRYIPYTDSILATLNASRCLEITSYSIITTLVCKKFSIMILVLLDVVIVALPAFSMIV